MFRGVNQFESCHDINFSIGKLYQNCLHSTMLKWFFVSSYLVTDNNKLTERDVDMIYHIERGKTHQEFIVPFKAKPRRYLEFETYFNLSKCGYHCTHSLR